MVQTIAERYVTDPNHVQAAIIYTSSSRSFLSATTSRRGFLPEHQAPEGGSRMFRQDNALSGPEPGQSGAR
jgi:hypothetical protein